MGRFLGCLHPILGRWVGFLDVVWYFFSSLVELPFQDGTPTRWQWPIASFHIVLCGFIVYVNCCVAVLAHERGELCCVSFEFKFRCQCQAVAF